MKKTEICKCMKGSFTRMHKLYFNILRRKNFINIKMK